MPVSSPETAAARWHRTRRCVKAIVAATVTIAGLTAAQVSSANAIPGDPAPSDFASSFETGQPQPTWTSTLETDRTGAPKAQGVTMTTTVGSGPSNGYNIRPNVGWTGVAALHYAGHQDAAGHGYAYDKVYDVNIPVAPSTELSYMVFPEATSGDDSDPSTYAGVDLAFTDGTYLSDLSAVDQHGKALSP